MGAGPAPADEHRVRAGSEHRRTRARLGVCGPAQQRRPGPPVVPARARSPVRPGERRRVRGRANPVLGRRDHRLRRWSSQLLRDGSAAGIRPSGRRRRSGGRRRAAVRLRRRDARAPADLPRPRRPGSRVLRVLRGCRLRLAPLGGGVPRRARTPGRGLPPDAWHVRAVPAAPALRAVRAQRAADGHQELLRREPPTSPCPGPAPAGQTRAAARRSDTCALRHRRRRAYPRAGAATGTGPPARDRRHRRRPGRAHAHACRDPAGQEALGRRHPLAVQASDVASDGRQRVCPCQRVGVPCLRPGRHVRGAAGRAPACRVHRGHRRTQGCTSGPRRGDRSPPHRRHGSHAGGAETPAVRGRGRDRGRVRRRRGPSPPRRSRGRGRVPRPRPHGASPPDRYLGRAGRGPLRPRVAREPRAAGGRTGRGPGPPGDSGVLDQVLDECDYFICSTEQERDHWLGRLSARHRAPHARSAAAPTSRDLIDVVAFGQSDLPFTHGSGTVAAAPLRRVLLEPWRWERSRAHLPTAGGSTEELRALYEDAAHRQGQVVSGPRATVAADRAAMQRSIETTERILREHPHLVRAVHRVRKAGLLGPRGTAGHLRDRLSEKLTRRRR